MHSDSKQHIIMNLRYVITSMRTPQDPNYPTDHTMLVAIATFEGGIVLASNCRPSLVPRPFEWEDKVAIQINPLTNLTPDEVSICWRYTSSCWEVQVSLLIQSKRREWEQRYCRPPIKVYRYVVKMKVVWPASHFIPTCPS